MAGADVGWTVLEPNNDNWKYGSAACSKRYECMALGVPQVADRLPLVPELIEAGGCGLCVPHDSAEAAAAAVNRLLGDEALRRQMGDRGRQLHREQFKLRSPVQARSGLHSERRPGQGRIGSWRLSSNRSIQP